MDELGRVSEKLAEVLGRLAPHRGTTANVQLGMAHSKLGELKPPSIAKVHSVGSDLGRMALAIVQTQVIRLLHGTNEPSERVYFARGQ